MQAVCAQAFGRGSGESLSRSIIRQIGKRRMQLLDQRKSLHILREGKRQILIALKLCTVRGKRETEGEGAGE
jgi:hypothetical protein